MTKRWGWIGTIAVTVISGIVFETTKTLDISGWVVRAASFMWTWAVAILGSRYFWMITCTFILLALSFVLGRLTASKPHEPPGASEPEPMDRGTKGWRRGYYVFKDTDGTVTYLGGVSRERNGMFAAVIFPNGSMHEPTGPYTVLEHIGMFEAPDDAQAKVVSHWAGRTAVYRRGVTRVRAFPT